MRGLPGTLRQTRAYGSDAKPVRVTGKWACRMGRSAIGTHRSCTHWIVETERRVLFFSEKTHAGPSSMVCFMVLRAASTSALTSSRSPASSNSSRLSVDITYTER